MIPKNLYALDLGTTKFCIARLKKDDDDAFPSIETVHVKADGMHRGMLSDMSLACKVLEELVEKAESKFSRDIHQVVVGVAGSHLAGKVIHSKIRIPSAVVEPDLLRLLKDQAVCDHREALREIIHCVPLEYKLDNREWIKSPTGFSGEFLHGRFFIMQADKHYLADIIQLCNQVGLEVKRLIAEPFASAAVTSSTEAKNLGVAIADIGGGTTDGIIFREEMPIGAFTINIGGKLMTKDLSIGLALPYEEAEKVKRHYGLSHTSNGNALLNFENDSLSQKDDFFVVKDIYGKAKPISYRNVFPILAPRIDELGILLEKELHPYLSNLGAGLLLTGGGSELKGICEYYASMDIGRIDKIKPRFSEHLEKHLESKINSSEKTKLASKFATVSGLLYLEIIQLIEERKFRKVKWLGQYFNQFVNWLKELS
ncbi:MAG: cell division protein FtsA [Bdellovibrionota bacterium]